jgi:protein TonB
MKIVFLLVFTLCLLQVQGLAQSEEPFTNVEKMPAFPDGSAEMYKFIYANLNYPAEAKKWKVSGQVITQFVVDDEGFIKNVRIVRGLGYGLDEEAMRVVELMNVAHRWTPGTHNGKAVPVTFTLPIKFVLNDK